MSRDVFVDTSGFYAALVGRDDRHRDAAAILRKAAKAGTRFATSDYVLDEAATLFGARGLGHLTDALFNTISSSEVCRIEWMDTERFEQTRRFFAKHSDQPWSFTDCFSFCLMKEFGLREALTKDEHFRQAGFRPLLA